MLDEPRDTTTASRSTPLSDLDSTFVSGIVDAAPDGFVIVDAAGRIILVNFQTEQLFGYDRDELLGKPVEELLPDGLRDVHRSHRTRYNAEPRTRPMGAGLSLAARRRDGTELPVEISLSPFGTDGTVIAVVRDISKRLESERMLREAKENLELLAERDRIARDLHDLVIQRLFASGMTLQGMVARIADADVAARIAGVIDDLDDTIRQLRSVIFALQQHPDDAPTLRAAALAVIAEQQAALGFEPRVQFVGAVDTVGSSAADELLPTLREALANVARHAAATAVTVEVAAEGDDLVLRVVDNGVGIAAAPAGGLGLRNARARAVALGGTCSTEAREQGGTVFEWSVPAAV